MSLRFRSAAPIIAIYTAPLMKCNGGRNLASSQKASPTNYGPRPTPFLQRQTRVPKVPRAKLRHWKKLPLFRAKKVKYETNPIPLMGRDDIVQTDRSQPPERPQEHRSSK